MRGPGREQAAVTSTQTIERACERRLLSRRMPATTAGIGQHNSLAAIVFFAFFVFFVVDSWL
jgi:hypothetical protein